MKINRYFFHAAGTEFLVSKKNHAYIIHQHYLIYLKNELSKQFKCAFFVNCQSQNLKQFVCVRLFQSIFDTVSGHYQCW